ncbi:hypothetical protein [Xanthomonas translucens]|uniref:hypothetical protein n=1 Tax=Xanthomonas campestris pv. translucens TaxID=343 RepID=UPI0012D8EE84|nr:hypothetical protein [Xanthomonas translucens]
MLAGTHPSGIRLPLALGSVVHVIRHARDLTVVVQLLELRSLLLCLRIVAGAQLFQQGTLLLVFGKTGHLKTPSSVVNQSNGMSFSS